ncbi:MAG: hypothetical protein A3J27_12060 [Candidatus Tectomicrobia bacterium RIFCSPLOWO2_12_FULL_69_37]|nr:MAG: hypothetical protein A3J27_12060 [Candidatus Tectomicrobia bacterium RIFCSPLOWO2_12_FULL_69_37]OGL64135.1 MAG: hypothetical protein A3I72_03290 [Candidatus Tectomicrobia bacterium RIFCSPLOWO2_02_FULL_70_19]
MARRTGWLLLCILAGALAASEAQAARVRVSQESKPGAGDFSRNVLGHLGAVLAAERTAGQFYAYNEVASWSYNGRQPVLREDASHLFFVRAKEGLALFLVHDKPNDADGGVAVTRIEVEGNSQTARMLVQDDPEGQRDRYQAGPRGASFTAWHMWNLCCTDGLVTGPYAGNWKIYVRFLEPPQGLRHWTALSGDGTAIRLRPEPGRRVLLEPMGFMVRRPRAPAAALGPAPPLPGPRLPVPARLLW